jgi:integral membrane sensor domain MASE1
MSDLLSDQRCTANAPAVHPKHYKLGMAFRYLLVCVAYYLGSMLGYALIFPSSYISIMWPPNTVLLVAMLLSRKRHWPWLLLMAYPVHLVAQSQFDVTPYMASLYYIFDCGLLLLTSSVLRRAGLDSLALCDLSQAVKFIAATTVSVAIGSLIWSPLIVYLAVGGNVWEQWMLVFLSNLLPFLCVAPGFVIGFGRGAQAFKNASPAQCTEFALLALGLLLCAIGVFGVAPQSLENIPALFYMPLPFLLWAAVRFGPGGAVVCLYDLRRNGDAWLDTRFWAVRHSIGGRQHSRTPTLSAGDVCTFARHGVSRRRKTRKGGCAANQRDALPGGRRGPNRTYIQVLTRRNVDVR